MSEQPLLYFAYGSNLHPLRLLKRVPSIAEVDVGELAGFDLRFHKRSSNDGSGKCDAFRTQDERDRVHGVVFRMDAGHRAMLDAIEGVGYDACGVTVQGSAGTHDAFTYLAQTAAIDASLRPFEWYKMLVLAGAELHGFPQPYVDRIRSQPSVPDPDAARAAEHEALLRAMHTWPDG